MSALPMSTLPSGRGGDGALRLEALDSLRGLAALAVLFSHALHVFPQFMARSYSAQPTWLEAVLKKSPLWMLVDGHGAVIVFFVLSGLVLSLPFQRGSAPAYPVFAAKRFMRLYPPYAAALLMAAALQALFGAGLPRDVTEWIGQANWTDPLDAATAADYVLMLGNRIALDNPVWSLGYEMRISLFLPVLLLPARRLGPGGHVATGLALLALHLVLRNLNDPQGNGTPYAGTLSLTALYAAMFALGAFLASQIERLRAIRAEWLPLVLLLLASLVFWRTWRDEMLTAGAALLIAAVLIPGPVARFCMLRPSRFLGRISYSLYLTHVPVLLTMLSTLHGVVDLPWLAAAFPPVALLVAALFHRAVEAPSHRIARGLGRGGLAGRAAVAP